MIFIGMGGNLPSAAGTPEETLRAAMARFPEYGLKLLRMSPLYRSAPIPESSQPWFMNMVVEIATVQKPRELLETLGKIETRFGRIRGGAHARNEPRTLDLDLIDYHGQVMETPELTLPHPRMHDRAFVLYPLCDLEPNWSHPVSRESITNFIMDMPSQRIEKLKKLI